MIDSSGFSQVLVLGGLLVVAGTLTLATMAAQRTSANMGLLFGRIEDETAASSATSRALTGFRAHDPGGMSSRTIVVGSTPVALTAENEGGKLNPVLAPPEVISAYIAAASPASGDRAALEAALAAARHDGDAEAAIAALYRWLAPVVPAQELEQDFSIYNPSAGVDSTTASERVLAALPDLDATEVRRILKARDPDPAEIAGLSAYFVSPISRFTLVASVPHADGTAFVGRVPFEITSAGSVLLLGRLP